MHQRLTAASLVLTLAALAAACGGDTTNSSNANNSNANANGNANAATSSTGGVRTAPDGSEIRTETADGVTTETRTFRDPNGRIERVVVTTRGGRRTARVYYRDRTVRELPESEVDEALDATADALVSAGGTVVDVSKEVGSEIGDKAEDVGDKAVSGAKKVGSEAADKAEDVGDKAVSGAKKAGKGVKKAGEKIGDAITP